MFVKISKIISIISILIAIGTGSVNAQDSITAKEFENRCYNEGAVDVVNELSVGGWDNPVWVNILENIASGDKEWLRASACIGENSGYSNGNIGFDVSIAWAEALPKNPRAVLTLSLMGISLGRICSIPIIEPTREWAAQYVKDTLAALEAIPDDAQVPDDAQIWSLPLKIERDVCILRLKDAYERKSDYSD